MSPRMAWRAIQAGLPEDAIISTDIGNNCAIGNAYPTFDEGGNTWRRASSAPAATAFRHLRRQDRQPDTPVVGFAGDGAFGISMNEMTAIGREDWPGDHHGRLPQLPVGRGKTEHHALVRRQLRRHRAATRAQLRQGGRGLRPQGRARSGPAWKG
jgi:hypothetical protein